MKVCVIGGANVDITATAGTIRVSWGGVGRNIAHNLALLGESADAVSQEIKNLKL